MSNRPTSINDDGSTVWACLKVVDYLKPLIENPLGQEQLLEKVDTVERHIAPFASKADFKRWMSSKSGGVRVSVLGVTGYEKEGNRIIGDIRFVAHVYAADKWGYQKDIRAEIISSAVARALMKNKATPEAYSKPMQVSNKNLYSGSIDELGVACWAVEWTQKWYVDVPVDETTLDEFITFGLKGELEDGAPTIEGEVKLPQ